MEVHHHSHTENKKWSHHFWEFFMMFLAISASFFVENQREHYMDRVRAKQYMVSMLADLKSDSLNLEYYAFKNEDHIKGLDSLFTYIREFKNGQHPVKELYRLFDDHATWVLRARLADRTISQLKNTGGMRLIHVQEISDSILLYEERKRLLIDQGDGYKRESDNLTDLSRRLLDYRYFFPSDIEAIPADLTINTALLFEFSNQIKILKDQMEFYVQYLREMLGHASSLIVLIRKKYHVK